MTINNIIILCFKVSKDYPQLGNYKCIEWLYEAKTKLSEALKLVYPTCQSTHTKASGGVEHIVKC